MTDTAYVRISPRDSHCSALSNGELYTSVGLSMISPPRGGMGAMKRSMRSLAAIGGNYIRVWLGH
jgi:hypothetical protein